MKQNENPFVLSAILLVISVVVALILSFTNSITKDKIADNTLKEQIAARQEVLPAASEFSDLGHTDGIVKGVLEGRDDAGNVVGWCVNVAPNGYGGEINIMVGISKDNELSGVQVISNSETASLGARCTEPEFLDQFKGKDFPLSVTKNKNAKSDEISAITGATITTKAVSQGVNEAYNTVKKIGGGDAE